jgi:hypothetical protein
MDQSFILERIKSIKEKIDDAKDYMMSDCCKNCIQMYNDILILEQQLRELENERLG